MKEPLKRGTRVFVAQVGFPQYGEHARIWRRVEPSPVPGEYWYSYRVERQKKLSGLIVHESWITVIDNRP